MSDATSERRTVTSPSRGLRLCLTIAALFRVATVYTLTAPIQVSTGSGKRFDCGTAINGPASTFAQGLCGEANHGAAVKAIALAVAALVIILGGLLTFGFDRREQ